ncbi:MAG: putative UDP-glucose 4-epimerase [Parcubacteria group bacterium Gr01-1014_8]|nr:MAG: putative UDP-glucose 4-epimerase [Parcubacteria group bacterium Gr01-1014_8]
MSTHVVVSGAAGFIGSHVCRKLSAEGLNVTALLHETATIPSVKNIRTNLLDAASVEKAIENCDVFIHLAGSIDINASLEAPRQRIEHNTSILMNVLETFRKKEMKPLIIFASTDRLYGTYSGTVTEKKRPVPIEPYTAAKIMCETLLETYQRLYDIPYIILRLDSVYGPGQPRSMFISDVIQKMISSDTITVGALTIRKNFIYVEDVADAFLCAMRAPQKVQNAVYNIGGRSIALKQIAQTVKNLLEHRLGKTITIVSSHADTRPARIEVSPFRLSTAKANKFLSWKPRTSLKDGLEKTITHFLTHNEKDKK